MKYIRKEDKGLYLEAKKALAAGKDDQFFHLYGLIDSPTLRECLDMAHGEYHLRKVANQ